MGVINYLKQLFKMSEDLNLPEEMEQQEPSTPQVSDSTTSMPEEYTVDSTEMPEFEEPTTTEEPIKDGWAVMRDYLSQSEEVEPTIKALMDKYAESHAVKVYKSEDESEWELFLVHRSSLPTHQTCKTLRDIISSGVEGPNKYGMHTWIHGTKEEVLEACTTL